MPKIIIIIVLFLIFLTQGVEIFRLKYSSDLNKAYVDLMSKNGEKISLNEFKRFLDDKNEDFNSLNEVLFKHKNLLFYKDSDAVYVKTFKMDYFAVLCVFGLGFLLFFSLLFYLYKIHIKSYKWHKNTMNTFFNDAMHELKTPLGVAIINLAFLPDSTAKKRIKAALNQIKQTYDDVEFYIKNPYTKYDLNKLNFSQILKERLEQFSTLMELKNIKQDYFIEDDLFVFLSETELVRIIDNNISNAVKYTKNSIKIRLFKRRENIYFMIYDNGDGIKDAKKIFNRYTRDDEALGGFGIGLNIVKNICLKFDISYKAKNTKTGALFIYEFKEYKKLFLDN